MSKPARFTFPIRLCRLTALFVLLARLPALDAQIVNGSFELPVRPLNTFGLGTPDGWQWAGTQGLIRNGIQSVFPPPQDGLQYVDIGNQPFYSLSQVVSVPREGLYELSWFDSTGKPPVSSLYTVDFFDSKGHFFTTTNLNASHVELWRQNRLTLPLVAGPYTLRFSSKGNGATYDTLIDQVSLVELVTIVSQPRDAQNSVNGRAVFNVAVTDALEPVTYQWYFNESPIPTAKSAEYIIDGLRFTDQGEYWVEITSRNVTVRSRRARLSVLPFKVSTYPAVELEFPSQLSRHYQVQGSLDLLVWTNVGPLIDGTGQLIHQLLATRELEYRFYRATELH